MFIQTLIEIFIAYLIVFASRDDLNGVFFFYYFFYIRLALIFSLSVAATVLRWGVQIILPSTNNHSESVSFNNQLNKLSEIPFLDHKLERLNTVFQLSNSFGKSHQGQPTILQIIINKEAIDSDFSDQDILLLATSLDTLSEHILSTAIVKQAKNKNLDIKPVTKFESLTSQGVYAQMVDK